MVEASCYACFGVFGFPRRVGGLLNVPPGGSTRSRARRYSQESSGCPWKGRRGAELAHRWREVGAAIKGSKSAELRAYLLSLGRADASQVLHFAERLADRVSECLQSKLTLWSHLPHKVVGILGFAAGGTKESSRKLAEECVAEFDVAMREHPGKAPLSSKCCRRDCTSRGAATRFGLGHTLGHTLQMGWCVVHVALHVRDPAGASSYGAASWRREWPHWQADPRLRVWPGGHFGR